MAKRMIDLCCDMGESFGNYRMGNDEEIIKYVSSVNVACGFHAGDPMVIACTVMLAKANKVAIGAHPGYPDLLGFGRRKLEISPEEAINYIIYQIGALKGFVECEDLRLQHVFLHGALQGVASQNESIAEAIIEGIRKIDLGLIFIGRPGLASYEAAKKAGLKVGTVIGVDIDYTTKGMAVIQRQKKNADPNEAAKKAIQIVKECKMTAVTGEDIEMKADSILVHGDTPNVTEVLREIRNQFSKEDIEVVPLKRVLGQI